MKIRPLFSIITLMLFIVMAAITTMTSPAESATRPRGKTADIPTFGSNGGAGFMGVLKADGSLWSSGYNAYGQLGNGTKAMNGIPVRAGSDNDWTTLVVGGNHMAAIKADGTLWTWGANHSGQLGIGTTDFYTDIPTKITSAGNNWRSVAVGSTYTVALRSDGTIWSWGNNSAGQLGDGTTTERRAPVQVTSLGSGNVAISAGANHTLAIKSDGTLWAWGDNSGGQLGIGSTSNSSTPVPVGTTIFEGFETGTLPKLPWVNGGDAAWTVSPAVTIGLYTYYPASGSYMTKAPTITANQNASKQLTLDCQAGMISFWYAVGSEPCCDGLKFYIDGAQQSFFRGAIGWTSASYAIAAGSHTFNWEYHKDGSIDTAPDTAVIDHITITPVNLHSWISVSAGTDHTVAINADGTVWAWGNNGSGQLGDGTTTQRISPIRITTFSSDVASVSAGSGHTLAVKQSGELWGWGSNGAGQLGCGAGCSATTIPQRIGTSNEWQAVAAGMGSSQGAMSDGTVWAWGLNNYGQLGDGTITTRTSPVKILWKGDFWKEVAGGTMHSVALKSDGTLWTWGANNTGQLGDKSNQDKHLPQKIGDNRWAGLGIGNHSLAVKSDGTLWGWGYGVYGQLGNGGSDSKNYPYAVSGTAWSAVAAGNYHSAGLKADGSLWTWGYDGYEGLGNGSSGSSYIPQQILADTTWLSTAIGLGHTAAVKSDGTLWSWGYNSNGQLGDGTVTTSTAPLAITSAGNGWLAVVCGTYHTLGLKSDGTLWAWGHNAYGQLGLGNTTQQSAPQQIMAGTTWRSVSAGAYHATAIRSDGTLWAWGYNGSGQLGTGNYSQLTSPQQIGTDTNWASISIGDNHTLAIKADGTLWAWGYNGNGQIGDWSTVNKNVPTWIDPQYTWLSVAAGAAHTLATKSDGTLWGWGQNISGELGDGTITDAPIPKRIGYTNDWSAVAAGWSYSIGLKTNGTLWGWGYGYYGNLGSGTPFNELLPQQIGIDTWKSFTVGVLHTLGIKSDGTLWGWGENGGKLGDGGTLPQYLPVAIAPGTTWSSVSAGNNHTLGIKEDGTLWAWGDNSYSQLGCGGACLAITNIPQQIGTASNWVSVAAGKSHSIGITSDGKMYGWGDNSFGQTGLGSGVVAATPLQIGTGTGWVAVASKYNHSLAVDSSGRLYTWGDNASGQLGNGGNSLGYTPVQVGSDTFWTGIFAAGVGHSVAANKNGMVFTWGTNVTRINTALNVTLSGLGLGTISASGMSCTGRSCAGSYEYGDTITLTAAADSNSSFSGWSGCTTAVGTSCIITMTQQFSTVYAIFNDTSRPTGSISIDADYIKSITKYTRNPTLSLRLSASDPVGVSQMQFSEDNSTWTAPEPYSISKQYLINTPTDKAYTIWARYIDSAGNVSNIPPKESVTLKRSGPTGATISITPGFISGGNKYTKISPVSLTVGATDSTGVAAMQFCNEVPETAGSCIGSSGIWSSPETFTTTKSWPLPAGNGAKTVYVRFKDNVGNWSGTANDSIIFDTALPSGAVVINNNAAFTTSPSVTLALSCSDVSIGCSEMQFSANGLSWSSPEPFLLQKTGYQLADGPSTIVGWGYNQYGQLGSGGTKDLNMYLPSGSGSDWSTLSAGGNHTLAVRSDGTLWAWGRNNACQLGLGSDVTCDDTNGFRTVPNQVGVDSDWVAVAAGFQHSLALKSDGSLWAWGYNGDGQLGIGTTYNQNTPQPVASGNSWRSIRAGYGHSLALMTDGSLWVWGDGSNGQLGLGIYEPGYKVTTPQSIKGEYSWDNIACGAQFSLAIRADGTLWAWGDNGSGQLGTGDTVLVPAPRLVDDTTSWSSIAAGADHSLGIRTDGSLWSWGNNVSRQLGCGDSCDKYILVPQKIQEGKLWASVAGGNSHSAGIMQDGSLWTWGDNFLGQLGTGDESPKSSPQAVAVETRFSTLAAGSSADFTSATPVSDTKYVFAKLKNNLGTWSTILLDSIVLDQFPPTGTFLINNGAAVTKPIGTTLTLTCSDPTSGCAEMCISNNGSCSEWETFTLTKSAWNLTPGDGSRTVYVWFRDSAGNQTSTPINANILQDGTGPTATVGFSGLTDYATNSGVTLVLSCADTVSGCSQMQFSNNGSNWSPLISFSSTAAWNLTDAAYGGTSTQGVKTVYSRFIDAAGNVTPISVVIFLDTGVPGGTVTFNGLSTYSTAASVTLTPLCIDGSGSGCTAMQFSNNGTIWSPLVLFAGSAEWDLTNSSYGGTSSDGSKTVYARYQDAAGNPSTAIINRTIILDRTDPTGSITINNSAEFTTSTNVVLTLSCNDATSGCATMEFNNDAGAWSAAQPFNASKNWALSAINGIRTVHVRFTDNAGKTSNYSSTINLDNTAPTTSVISPTGFSNLVNSVDITLSCADGTNTSGCVATYYTLDGTTPSTSSTSYSGGPITISGMTSPATIKFFSVDSLGNTEAIKTAAFTFIAGYTTLTLDTPPTHLQNELLNISGKLTRFPDTEASPNNGMNLSGLAITLTVSGPPGSSCGTLPCTISQTMDAQGQTHPSITYSSLGHYEIKGIDKFNYPGLYTLRAHFGGTGLHQAADSTIQTILVGASAGYAIIVEGKVLGGDGLDSHNKTTNRIYATLKERGFEDDNIMYYNYGGSMIPGVDAIPSKSAIQAAITTWAKDRMNGSPAPLYVIFVDHGNSNIFYIDPATITPSELSGWLSSMESQLIPAAKLQKRIIILGACYSGSFLNTLKQGPTISDAAGDPNAGRIVISSAAADEQSYKGASEPDGIRSGEFFMEELFKQLKKGSSLKTAFVDAAALTRSFTSQGGGSQNSANGYNDNAVQHPLLEDDGLGQGSNTLADGIGDGIEAANIHLGVGVTNASLGPADIKKVTSTQYLGPGTTPAETQYTIELEAYSNAAVSSAWFEVKSPDIALPLPGLSLNTFQLDLDLPRWTMTLVGAKWQATYGLNPPHDNEKFATAGKYEVFYFTKSKNAEISEMRRSVVYKNYADNQAPSAFNLVAPVETTPPETIPPTIPPPPPEAQVRTEFNMVWSDSSDPDGLTYTVQVASDEFFQTIVFQKEEIENSWYSVDKSAGLSDDTHYFWRVIAVDRFGGRTTSSQQWRFHTNNTNFPSMCLITGAVSGVIPGKATEFSVMVLANDATVAQTSTFSGGNYFFNLTPGSYKLRAAATGYTVADVVLSFSTCPSTQTNLTATINTISLQTTTQGGVGTVNCTKNSGASCSGSFQYGDSILLTASPSWRSLFGSWSGGYCNAITSPTCSFTLKLDTTETANFTPINRARVASKEFSSLQEAYDDPGTGTGAVIKARVHAFEEPNLIFDQEKVITIEGGFDDSDYTATSGGYTTVKGTVTVKKGTLKLKGTTKVR